MQQSCLFSTVTDRERMRDRESERRSEPGWVRVEEIQGFQMSPGAGWGSQFRPNGDGVKLSLTNPAHYRAEGRFFYRRVERAVE